MKNEIKTASPVQLLPVVENPQLIRVLALSQKFFDQMIWLNGQAGYNVAVKWDEFEIIGAHQGSLIVRHKETKHINRVRGIAYIEYAMQNGQTNDEANQAIAHLPQIFLA